MATFSVQSLNQILQYIKGQATTYGRLVLFFIRKENMNKQQLSEIVRGELNEMIGFDVEPVAVPKNAAADLGDAHALIIKAMELMEKAKNEAVSDELQTEIQKVQDSLIRGATDAMTALVDLVSMESSLADE